MALVLTIGGTDRTNVLLRNTLVVEQQAADFISICSLTLYDADGTIAVSAEDAITVVDTATYFSGRVVDIRYERVNAAARLIHLRCQDLNYQLIETVIDTTEIYPDDHPGVTADANIIDDLFDTYLNTVVSDDFALNQTIQDPLTITFAPCTLRSALSQICTHTGGYFYIDFDNKLHYFSTESNAVAWWLSDDPDQVDSFSYLLKDTDMESTATVRLDGIFVIGAGVEGWRGTHAVGDRQGIVRDNRITTATGVNNRGDAILAKYGSAQTTHTISTYKVGLRAGMDVRFICALYGVDDTFTVRRMLVKWDVAGTVYFTLTLGAVVNPSLIGERKWTDTLDDALRPVSAPRLPTSSRGWSHNLVFSATDNDTVAWAAAGVITLADGTTYTIDAGNTGNIAAITYIYLDIDTSTTVLQTTTTNATAVGSGKILIAVAENVADATKDATFQVFGGEGQGVLVSQEHIAALSVTTNEIAANTILAGNIAAGAIETDELAALAVTAAKIAANTITADKIEMGIGDGLFNAADGLLLLGPHCEINATEWWSARKQKATLSGAFHQEAGRWLGTHGLIVEKATTNLILNPSIETNTTGWTADDSVISLDSTYSVFGDAALKVITNNVGATEGVYADVTTETAASTEYTFSVYLRGSGTVYLMMWDTVGGTQWGDAIVLTNTWTRYQITKTFSTGAARRVWVDTQAQQNITFYCDGFQLEASDYATTYCDGTLGTGYAWTGAAHGSTSTRTQTTLNLDAHIELISGNSTLTFAAWIQMPYDADADWAEAISYCFYAWGAGGNVIRLYFSDADSFWNANAEGGGTSVAITSSGAQTFVAGDWICAALTLDFSGDMILYINGIEHATGDISAATAPTLTTIQLGLERSGGDTGAGFTLGQFAVFDRVLTAIEVAGLYALQRPMVDLGSLDTPGIYLLDGRFQLASSISGNRIDITADEIAGYSSGNVKQFYLSAADGVAYAGAGAVILDENGLRLEGDGSSASMKIRFFYDASDQLGRIYSSFGGAPGAGYLWVNAMRSAGDPWNACTLILQANDTVAGNDTRITVQGGDDTVHIGGATVYVAGELEVAEVKFPSGGSGTNWILIPDNVADALHISDVGGVPVEYLRLISTGAAWAFAIDPGAAGVNVGIGMVPTANGVLSMNLPTKNFEIIDAGSAGATEQDWVECEIGTVQGYLHVFAAK